MTSSRINSGGSIQMYMDKMECVWLSKAARLRLYRWGPGAHCGSQTASDSIDGLAASMSSEWNFVCFIHESTPFSGTNKISIHEKADYDRYCKTKLSHLSDSF